MFPFEQAQDHGKEIEQHHDDISGKWLPPELMRAGRTPEIRWCESIKLCDKVPKQQLREESNQPQYAGSMYAQTKEALLAHDFAAQCLRGDGQVSTTVVS